MCIIRRVVLKLLVVAQVDASNRGVHVRIAISAPTSSFPDDDLFSMVPKAPAIDFVFVNMTALIGSGVMHAKYMVIDRHSLYLGSANFGAGMLLVVVVVFYFI